MELQQQKLREIVVSMLIGAGVSTLFFCIRAWINGNLFFNPINIKFAISFVTASAGCFFLMDYYHDRKTKQNIRRIVQQQSQQKPTSQESDIDWHAAVQSEKAQKSANEN